MENEEDHHLGFIEDKKHEESPTPLLDQIEQVVQQAKQNEVRRRKTSPKKATRATNSRRRRSPVKESHTPSDSRLNTEESGVSGKQSTLKRELRSLNLSKSKAFASLYEGGDFNQQVQEVQEDEPIYKELRTRSVQKSTYVPRTKKQVQADEKAEQTGFFASLQKVLCSNFFLVPFAIGLAVCTIYWNYFMKAPYCDSNVHAAIGPRCSYNRHQGECIPCPFNAKCEQSVMECDVDHERVGELCLHKDDNPYVAKLVAFLYEVDQGMLSRRTFMDFGAKHTHQIRGDELLTILGAETTEEKTDAGEAFTTVLDEKHQTDRFCLANKFAAQNAKHFATWEEIVVTSLRLGPPAPTQEGAVERNEDQSSTDM